MGVISARVRSSLHGRHGISHKYALLGRRGRSQADTVPPKDGRLAIIMLLVLAALAGLLWSSAFPRFVGQVREQCDTVYHGYQCDEEISHSWGQYSPYFSVPSDITDELPEECEITFVQILSRHGARDPTSKKTREYNETIQKVKRNVKSFPGPYAFLASYEYMLGSDQLTTFGQQEMTNSGIKFYRRYERLASQTTPFFRSSGEARVVESAENFAQGFHVAKLADPRASKHRLAFPYPIVTIPEVDGENNTLHHDLCTAFENGTVRNISEHAQTVWMKTFIPPVQMRLNTNLVGANLSQEETIDMMELCPFNTVATLNGSISPFCMLFEPDDWHNYNYYATIGKYYGYSYGNPLGPTQGVGFARELISRLTDEPVQDGASINSTLDASNSTFPLGRKLYADFSHDNDMTAIFSALGLYNGSRPLPNTTVVGAEQAKGYSAAWTVPFAARAFFEKMRCGGRDGELVRVVMNDRVLPLTQCGGDQLGRCTLDDFIDSLGFARAGGDWNECFS